MRLNPILMDYVKSLAFQHFPSEEGERQSSEWAPKNAIGKSKVAAKNGCDGVLMAKINEFGS